MARLAGPAFLAAVFGLVAARAAPPARDAGAPALVVIAHATVHPERVDRNEARRMWLLRRRFWHDGTRIVPVNLPASSPVRDAFSRAVLGSPARDLVAFWNDLYFHGTLPPPVLPSERAVMLFVARTPGAAGYVTESSYLAARAEDSAIASGTYTVLTFD